MAKLSAKNLVIKAGLDETSWPSLGFKGASQKSQGPRDGTNSTVSTAPSTPNGGHRVLEEEKLCQGNFAFEVAAKKLADAKAYVKIAPPPGLEDVNVDEDDMSSRRIEDLVKTLADTSDAKLQEEVCKELRQLARESPENKGLIGELGGVAAVLRTMKANSEIWLPTMKGMTPTGPIRTLENITARHAKNCALLLKLEGVDTVLQTMAHQQEEPEVQHMGCRVVLNAAMLSAKAQEQVVALGAIEAVVRAMSTHGTVASVQEAGCRALKEFAAFSSTNQEKIASNGGLPAVLRAMESHADAPRIQEFAFGVLRNMCSGNAEYQDCVAAREGIGLVLLGMKSHPEASSVQWAGCWALFCLGVHNPDIQKEIVTHRGVQAITQVMDSHRSDGKVQESACWALRDLIQHAAEGSFSVSTILQPVLRAMEKHTKSPKVQTAAKAVLNKLASHGAKGWVKTSILGRCGRMGRSTTMRALSAIQEDQEE